jgi:uncharacterized repeat protein (TIGR02543 family)
MKKIARLLTLVLVASLFSSMTGVSPANAEPGTLTENFGSTSLDNPQNWVATASGNTGVHPCLTALKNSEPEITLAGGTLAGCKENPDDVDGAGALILTTNGAGQTATMLYNSPLPSAAGLDISFYQAQWGGTGADGISFFVKDGNKDDLTTGLAGGGLGYKGIPGALFGIGFDSFGNWLNISGSSDEACPDPAVTPKSLAIRGPDTSDAKDGSKGFCVLPGGSAGSIGAEYFGSGPDTRLDAARPVRVVVDPTTDDAPQIRVYMWKSGDLFQDETTAPIQLVVDQPAEYKDAEFIKFGFSASTGGANNNHAVWGLQIAPISTEMSPTLYVVPQDAIVRAGEEAVYTYKFYSDEDKTIEIPSSQLTFTGSLCGSDYLSSTNYQTFPTPLEISCDGAIVALYNTVVTETAILTVVQGTPAIAPLTQEVTTNVGTPITATAVYVSRNFKYAADIVYSVAPALPLGLSINPSTGVISGTPTGAPETNTFTVTATSNVGNLVETASATLVIKIEPAKTFEYSIMYDKGSGTSGTLATQSGTGTSVTLSAFSTSNMVKTGSTFSGWLGSDGNTYSDAQALTFNTPLMLTLTAQWLADPIPVEITYPYAISYDANGGTGTMSGQTGTGNSAKLLANAFTRTGFTFAGWEDDAGNVYTDQQLISITAPTSLALHAQWKADPKPIEVTYPYAITFDANGGTGIMAGQAGIANNVKIAANKFTKAKSLFNGWKDDAGISYVDGQNITLTAVTTLVLHAQWITNDLGIDDVKCLGNFAASCALKPGALQPVSFKTNSNLLSPKSIAILKKWKLQNAKSVFVYGYASKDGSKALNDRLTAKRASEVGAWLKKNWPNLKIQTKGLGTKVNVLCKKFDNKCAMIKIVSLKK